MTEREIKKLSRADLLQLLLEESKENETLKSQIEEYEKKLSERQLHLEKAGSLAEAVLMINGVMEAAQAAADQYLENLKMMNGDSAVTDGSVASEGIEKNAESTEKKNQNPDNKGKRRPEVSARPTFGGRRINIENQSSVKGEPTASAQLENDTLKRCRLAEEKTAEKCKRMEEEVVQRCERFRAHTKAECEKMIAQAKKESSEIKEKAEAEAEALLIRISKYGITEKNDIENN